MTDLVWYASYGSNMCAERFGCYLSGGIPTGSTRDHTGCRDATAATEDRAIVLPGAVFFSGTSRAWTGGHAYLDPIAWSASVPALGRAWLVTADQFDDIVAQENSRPVGSLGVDAASMGPGEQRVVETSSRYPIAWCIDSLDGVPVVTFTCAERMSGRLLNPPSLPYLRTLALGLVEAGHADELERAVEHLCALPGVDGHWTPADLGAALSG